MNPWSGAEGATSVPNVTDATDEASERELFARRARALEPAALPSLASILRAADVPVEAVVASSTAGLPGSQPGRGRTVVAMLLAAACMTAAITRLPGTEARQTISAEDAGAPGMARFESTMELASSEEVCSMDNEVASAEESACVSPAPVFAAASNIAMSMPPTTPCVPNESCAIGNP